MAARTERDEEDLLRRRTASVMQPVYSACAALLCLGLASGCGGGGTAAQPVQTPIAQPSAAASFPAFLSCTAPPVQIGQTVYQLIVTGDEAPTFGAMTNPAAQYYKFTIATPTPTPTPSPIPTPSPSPTPTPLPTPTPTPSPTPRQLPVFYYTGSYIVNSMTAPTTGCVFFITSTDGSPLYVGARTYSALGGGEPNSAGIPPYQVTNITQGNASAISLSLTNSGTGSGSFTFDNGDTGTITLDGRTNVEYTEALRRARALQRRVSGL